MTSKNKTLLLLLKNYGFMNTCSKAFSLFGNIPIIKNLSNSVLQYWADKKSTVRSKVQGCGGDPNSLCSNIEKKIWDVFLANDNSSKFY